MNTHKQITTLFILLCLFISVGHQPEAPTAKADAERKYEKA